MSVRSLFLVILKVLGLFFVRDFIATIPQLLTIISLFINYDGYTLSPLMAAIISVAAYGYIAFVLLFKTEWVIDMFSLDKGFEVDALQINIHRSTVLGISTIVIGALMAVNGFPPLAKHILEYYQVFNSATPDDAPRIDWGNVTFYTLQIIIGLLIVGHQRQIVNYIELKRRKEPEPLLEEDEETPDDQQS